MIKLLLIFFILFSIFVEAAEITKSRYTQTIEIIKAFYVVPLKEENILEKAIVYFIDNTEQFTEKQKTKIKTKFKVFEKSQKYNRLELAKKKYNSLEIMLENQMYTEEEAKEILLESLVESLDLHSRYLTQKEYRKLTQGANGEFGGLGITISIKNKQLLVISPIDGTPADKAGMKAGDIILNIDNISIKDMSIDTAVSLMRGKVNTPIVLSVLHLGDSASTKIRIVRGLIRIKSLKVKQLKNDILYLKISAFDNHLIADLNKTLESDYNYKNGIILDFRNNPGGLQNVANDLLNFFIKKGVLFSTQGNHESTNKMYEANTTTTKYDLMKNMGV